MSGQAADRRAPCRRFGCSGAPAGIPDRLTVQLPPASLDATARLIGDYAARWGFPAGAVTDWHASAAQRAPDEGYYGTQVFTPPEIGSVHLEFQVSHHVPERDFVVVVVVALFSWHAQAILNGSATEPLNVSEVKNAGGEIQARV